MLILRKPKDVSKYICIDDFGLNLYLQKKDYHPRYYYDGLFYYSIAEQLQQDIELYSILKKESEVSEFGESL